MSEPIYHGMLGLYLRLDDLRKAIKPGQQAYIWYPPHFERIEGVIGEGWGAGMNKPILLFKMKDGSIFEITDQNVFLFQPRSKRA